MDGAGNRSRTYDLRITNALLYQLSYTGAGLGVSDTSAHSSNECTACEPPADRRHQPCFCSSASTCAGFSVISSTVRRRLNAAAA